MAIERVQSLTGGWDELIVADIQVEVSDFSTNKRQELINVLEHASGREVSFGVSGCILYAYFSDGDLVRAHAAQLDAETAAYCKTRLRRGSFNVSNLRVILRSDAYCTASVEEVRAAARLCELSFWYDEEYLLVTWLDGENTPVGCAQMINRMIECFPEKFTKGRK